MISIKAHKIHYFLLCSIVFHTILFLVWSSFASLNKNREIIEVLMISQSTEAESPNSDKSNLKRQKIHKRKPEIIPEETKKTEESIGKAEKIELYKSETTTGYEEDLPRNSYIISQHYKISNQESSSESKIIDSEFGSLLGPRFIYQEKPTYPPIARRLGKEGKVLLRLTINEKGDLINIEVIESAPYGFTEAAVEAIRKSKFSPAKKDGKPIASRVLLPIKFILTN